MAGNADNQYASASNESNPEGLWGATPPIMHSWCLLSDEPASDSVQTESRRSKPPLASDADDDCGFDLNLGLSLGGGKSNISKGREKEKEKEVLDRDTFGDKDNFRADIRERRDGVISKDVTGEEPYLGGVMFKPFKTEQDDANPNPKPNSFWQDFDRAGSEVQDKAMATSFLRPVQTFIPNQQQAVKPSRWEGDISVAENSKMFAQHMWQALQGKAAQLEHQRVPIRAQDEAFIKELQGLPPQAVATSAAWARVVAQGDFPMQILEAIKGGVDPGTSRGMALQRSMSVSKPHSSGPHSEEIPAASPPMSQQMAALNAGLERSDSDVSKNMQIFEEQHRQVAIVQQQEIVEQQRKRELQTQKRQEARRKRKALLEGQKSKKSSKKEEERPGSGGLGGSQGSRSSLDTPLPSLRRTSSLQPSSALSKESSISMGSSPLDSQDAGGASSLSAFRRPGSTSWLHNWDGNNPQMVGMGVAPVKAKSGKDGRMASCEQMVEIQRALERARDTGTNDTGEDGGGHVETEVRKLSSPDVVQMQKTESDSNAGARQVVNRQEGPSLGPPPGMVNGPIDPLWIQKIMEMQLMMPNFPEMQRRGDGGVEREAPMADTKSIAKKGRASSQTSSDGTESSGGQDERSFNGVRVVHGDADSLSSPAANSTAGELRSNSPNAMMPSVSNAMAMANMAFPQGGGFSIMPGVFPFPLPVPPGGGPSGVPFSVPFPFPYLMQFSSNPATAGDGNPEKRAHPNMPSPFQIALASGVNPSFQIQTSEGASAWPSLVVSPDATPLQSPPRSAVAKPSQSGLSRDDKHGPRGAKGKEHAMSRNSSPARDLPAQSLVEANSMGSGVFNRLRTTGVPANSSPLAPQFGIYRSKSDAVVLQRREVSVGSAFAVTVEQQLSLPPPSNGQNISPTETGPKGSTRVGSVPLPEPTNSRGATASGEDADPSASGAPGNSHQPEVAVAQSGSVPSFEGIAGQEASSLRPGVAPGLHFGGTGTTPDLPWVTCNGTISGVLYRVEKGQVRIVCACHGRHMTPAEFVQHAGCGEISNPEKAIVVGPFTVMSQQTASAQA